jgi:hypothetical protein
MNIFHSFLSLRVVNDIDVAVKKVSGMFLVAYIVLFDFKTMAKLN